MRQYNSNTFVCFIDISGFKAELNSDINSAGKMLDTFYSAGYNVLKEYKTLNGIFVSDCGILYPDKGKISDKLDNLLGAVRQINRKMLNANYLTTASIAFGHLEYKRKFVFDRIKKNAIIGSGYLNSFLDNEHVQPKLRPGQVRITKALHNVFQADNLFDKINFAKGNSRFLTENDTHFYFNWLCKNFAEKGNTNGTYLVFDKDQSIEKFEKLKIALKAIR